MARCWPTTHFTPIPASSTPTDRATSRATISCRPPLDIALFEGAAEYVAYRLTGRLGAPEAIAYGRQHEAAVRQQFSLPTPPTSPRKPAGFWPPPMPPPSSPAPWATSSASASAKRTTTRPATKKLPSKPSLPSPTCPACSSKAASTWPASWPGDGPVPT